MENKLVMYYFVNCDWIVLIQWIDFFLNITNSVIINMMNNIVVNISINKDKTNIINYIILSMMYV